MGSKTTDWRQRAQELELELHAVQDKLERARVRRTAVLERLQRYEHTHLDATVLAHLLPARAASWRDRPPDPSAIERHTRHLAASEAYAAQLAGGAQPSEAADHVAIDGLEFWVPQDRRIPGRLADDLLKGRLPLDHILQTREAIGGGVMLDVGANIGTTAIPRAVLGDYAVVYGAEPEPANFACLVAAVQRNGLAGVVLPDRCALSDRDGVMRLRRSTSIGGHRLDDAAEDGLEVPVYTLSGWVKRLGVETRAVQFVKIDTQGQEGRVLAGAGALVEQPGIVWQLEFSPKHLRLAGTDPADFIARLQQTFSWFIDLYSMAPGNRVRPTAELSEALGYLGDSFTDLLVYRGYAA